MNLLDQFRLRPTIAGFGGNTIPIGQRTTGPFIPNQGVGAIRPTESPLNPPPTGPTQIQKTTEPVGLNEFRQYLQNQPERKDYQLGKLGKALSMAAGAAEGYNRGVTPGINVGMGLLNRPYEEAKEDWETRGGRLKELYELGRTERGEGRADVATQLAQNKDMREQAALYSQLNLNEAELQQKLLDVAAGKTTAFKGEDGNFYEYDLVSKKLFNRGKVGLGEEGRAELDQKNWRERWGYEHFGRVELASMNQAHDKVMAGINYGYANKLAETKGRLDRELATHQAKVDPRMRTAAMQGAMNELFTIYPGMRQALFDTDDEGNLVPKLDQTGQPIDVQAYEQFSNALIGKTMEYLGVPYQGAPPWSNTPIQDMPLRIRAINWLREQNLAPTQDQIKKAMEDFRREDAQAAATVQGTGVPQVTAPTDSIIPPGGFFSWGDPGTWQGGLERGVRGAVRGAGSAIGGALSTPTLPSSGPMIPGAVNAPSEIPILPEQQFAPPRNIFTVRPHTPVLPGNPLLKQRGYGGRY